MKLLIALGCAGVLAIGVLSRPPAPAPVAPPPERAAPLLEQEVQRREQLRVFGELQALGPRLSRHSVTIPAPVTAAPLPSDLDPPAPRLEPAGHGLIVSADGEVLTTAAAVGGRERFSVGLADGTWAEARVVAFDSESDLVLLRAEPLPRSDAAPWALDPPPSGMLAVAVSHSQDHVAVSPVFVTGPVDAAGRIRTSAGGLLSGTPIYTVDGEVFAIASGGDDPSASLVAPAVERLRARIAAGQPRRGAIGLTFQPVEGALERVFTTSGALVADVTLYGPAADAGVRPGDLLTAIGETTIDSVDAARAAIAALEPGVEVTLHLERGRSPLTLQVTPTSALQLRALHTPRLPALDAPDVRAVLGDEVPLTTALLPRSRILAVNGVQVASAAEARAALRRARGPVLLYVEDERGRSFHVLEPPE